MKRLIGRKYKDPVVQSDVRLWPFKVGVGKNDRPTVRVTYRNELRSFLPEEVGGFSWDSIV